MERSRRFHIGVGSKRSNSRRGRISPKVMAMMIRNAVAPFVAYRRWRPADDATYQRGLATRPVVVQPIAQRPSSLVWRPSSIVDLNCGGHTGRKDDIAGYLIDMDANRDALGQAYPGEDGIDGCNALTVRLRVRNVDCAGDAVDVTAHELIAAHQLDLSRIPHLDRSKVRLLEISVDPE